MQTGPIEKAASTEKPLIRYDVFQKLDLRVATIRMVEDVPDTDKLYKLTLDVGELGERVIVAGMKLAYPTPSIMVGQQIVIIANLEARKMRGIMSQGMLLAASNADHTDVRCITPERTWNRADGVPLPPGSSIS